MARTAEDLISAFDTIAAERRSTRAFAAEMPPREVLVELLRVAWVDRSPSVSALLDPQELDLRRFIVLERGSEAAAQAAARMLAYLRTVRDGFFQRLEETPPTRGYGQAVAGFMDRVLAEGFSNLADDPYTVIVAERRIFPRGMAVPPGGDPGGDTKALIQAVQNVWLKATAMGLGFRLISNVTQMSEDDEFCALIGVEPGEWRLEAFSVGIPEGDGAGSFVLPAPAAAAEPIEAHIWWR